jgi:glutamate--cysteine ligase
MADNNETYYSMAMRKACEQRDYFRERPPSDETIAKYRQLAEQSIQRQAEIEASDNLSFDEFLANY